MSYMHIENLYRNQTILEFPEIYSMEKIHGTSAHIRCKRLSGESLDPIHTHELTFFSGGASHEEFRLLFDEKFLLTAMSAFDLDEVVVFGEAYGGKMQAMKATYGDKLKFIVFDVKFNGNWLTVPQAENVANMLKLEFVDYVKIKTTLAEIDAQRDRPSVQAIRNGMGENHKREGIVLRPLEELTGMRGRRIIAKHKNAEFCETKTPREVDPNKKIILEEARAIAEEWVTENRLQHVVGAAQALLNATKGVDNNTLGIEDTKTIIEMMIEDVKREAKGEIIESEGAMKQIGSRTAKLYRAWLNISLKEKVNG